MRSLREVLTLQTATTTKDGFESVETWTDGTTITATLVSVGLEARNLMGIPAEREAFQAVTPKGLTLSTDAHRFKRADDSILRVRRVVPHPRGASVTLEATQ